MSITISNLRIIPYGQKDVIKPVFGDTMHLTFRLADAPQEGDRYLLGLDYERILFPTMRPLCAYTEDYTASQSDVSFDLEINTERFARWASGLKKPTPIWLQLVRVRGEEYTTLLLDDVLALPSVVDGANMVFPGTPLDDILREKADLVDGKVPLSQLPPIGFEQVQSDWDESDSSEPSYIKNKPTDFGSQQATDAEIDARESTTHTITPNNLEYAARSVLPNVTTIPAATTSYNLLDASATTNNHSWQYFHAPEAASTYTFPAVADTAVAHRIKLTIDFTTVQTYSFEDAEGTAIAPLFTPTISAGDVYEFDCEYSAVKAAWLIYPQKQGAVADDFVMRGEVGAANGVAGLDSNALVSISQLPIATANQPGVIRSGTGGGIKFNSSYAYLKKAGNGNINVRGTGSGAGESSSTWGAIVPENINYAVTAALTDANKIQMTDAQKASAQDALGIWSPPVTVIPAATTQYTLAEGMQSHVPEAASVYTLPASTGSTRTHECILTVRFSSSVLTYAFEDSAGNPVTPLPLSGTIADGSVVAFRCTWEALLNSWVIMPVMLGTYAEVEP